MHAFLFMHMLSRAHSIMVCDMIKIEYRLRTFPTKKYLPRHLGNVSMKTYIIQAYMFMAREYNHDSTHSMQISNTRVGIKPTPG